MNTLKPRWPRLIAGSVVPSLFTLVIAFSPGCNGNGTSSQDPSRKQEDASQTVTRSNSEFQKKPTSDSSRVARPTQSTNDSIKTRVIDYKDLAPRQQR